MTRGPLRRVVRCVRREGWSPNSGQTMATREQLECGHLFDPPYGLHGTTVGDRDSRRCPHCAAGRPADDLTGWEEL
jgi:hypothetical protein